MLTKKAEFMRKMKEPKHSHYLQMNSGMVQLNSGKKQMSSLSKGGVGSANQTQPQGFYKNVNIRDSLPESRATANSLRGAGYQSAFSGVNNRNKSVATKFG
jgi:hypothetical protein